jgi:hypothetical protein
VISASAIEWDRCTPLCDDLRLALEKAGVKIKKTPVEVTLKLPADVVELASSIAKAKSPFSGMYDTRLVLQSVLDTLSEAYLMEKLKEAWASAIRKKVEELRKQADELEKQVA